ncbi:hypothetical protein ETB97_000922, partial [Aspergillus alliaceus]
IDVNAFELALSLWAISSQISREVYVRLHEILLMIDSEYTQSLPSSLDTLKRRVERQLSFLPIKKRSIPIAANRQPSHSQKDTENTLQYWFDPVPLFHRVMCSKLATEKIHFGMAEYSDNPTELWHSRAWGSSIAAVSGDFAYTEAQDTIFPSDCLHITPLFIPELQLDT